MEDRSLSLKLSPIQIRRIAFSGKIVMRGAGLIYLSNLFALLLVLLLILILGIGYISQPLLTLLNLPNKLTKDLENAV